VREREEEEEEEEMGVDALDAQCRTLARSARTRPSPPSVPHFI
jgi:hypothetical protein